MKGKVKWLWLVMGVWLVAAVIKAGKRSASGHKFDLVGGFVWSGIDFLSVFGIA